MSRVGDNTCGRWGGDAGSVVRAESVPVVRARMGAREKCVAVDVGKGLHGAAGVGSAVGAQNAAGRGGERDGR